LGPIALGGSAIVFALWFGRYYDQPQWLSTDVFAWGLFAVLAAYAAAATAAGRTRQGFGIAVLAGAAGLLALLWLAMGDAMSASATLGQLLALTAVVLAICLLRRWDELGPVALAAAAGVFAAWFAEHYDAPQWARISAFAWAFFALLVAYDSLATALRRMAHWTGIPLLAGAGALLAMLWLAMGDAMSTGETLGHLLVLDVVVLTICLLRRWHWLRVAMTAWTIIVMLLTYWDDPHLAGQRVFWSVWTWVFFAVLTVDVMIRAWWRRIGGLEKLDATLGTVATALMFAVTYHLLRQDYKDWMGGYTVLLAAAALLGAWLLRRLAHRRVMAYAFL
ncbi:hypothetical protein LCGC14_3161790, partial [marine sediment metagenome]